jgi:formylglycine-generating enzyme required for sulfatase activity
MSLYFLEERAMKNAICLVVVCVMAAANNVSADNIRGVDIDFVTIDHAGNAADTGGTVGDGAVAYNYRIGKYEVTNQQWDAFTANAGVPTENPAYPSGYGGYSLAYTWGRPGHPVVAVSLLEAAQFCNYLTSGNKFLGAYTIGNGFITPTRASAISTYGKAYVIPTEDEWYKAAYFKPDGSGYSSVPDDYGLATGFALPDNAIPSGTIGGDYGVGDSRFGRSSPWEFGSGTLEQNGTKDMMGNVWEYNEDIITGPYVGIRGGSYGTEFLNYGPYTVYNRYLGSRERSNVGEAMESIALGFRVAEVVPEPATIALFALGSIALFRKK